MSSIIVNQEKFDQVCKRVNKQLPDQKLSAIHELLAGGFGFRSYNAAQSYFNKTERTEPVSIKPQDLKLSNADVFDLEGFTKSELLSVFQASFIDTENSGWHIRAKVLLDIIIRIIDDERSTGRPINMSRMVDLLRIDEIAKTYAENANITSETRQAIEDYWLGSVPGAMLGNDGKFDIRPVQREQHGYLTSLLNPGFLSMKRMEQMVVCLFKPAWIPIVGNAGRLSISSDLKPNEAAIIASSWLGDTKFGDLIKLIPIDMSGRDIGWVHLFRAATHIFDDERQVGYMRYLMSFSRKLEMVALAGKQIDILIKA